MSNMNYCRFHNTLLDLVDCTGNFDDETISEEEHIDRYRMLEEMRKVVKNFEGYDKNDFEYGCNVEEEAGVLV